MTELRVEAPSPTPVRPIAAINDDEPATEALPISQLRRSLDDLFAPRAAVYWLDFLASAACGYGGFAIAAALPLGNPATPMAWAVSVLGLYRAIIFIHELAHLPPGRLPGFRLGWHLICGIPLLAPAFLYGSHADHHRRPAYGTDSDGEYLPWGTPGHRLSIAGFVLSSLASLPAAALRLGVLAPLAWLNRPLRDWLVVHASSLVVDLRYRRPLPAPAETRRWRRQEAAAFAYLVVVATGLAAGIIAAAWLVQLWLTLSAAMLLNALRTLAAHRYRSAGRPLSATEQLLDSVNYPHPSWLTPLWAPVGLRYHALHHLFAGLPYHNLGAAHARIVRLLPADSPYHRTEGRSLSASLRELWDAARAEPGLAVRGDRFRRSDAG